MYKFPLLDLTSNFKVTVPVKIIWLYHRDPCMFVHLASFDLDRAHAAAPTRYDRSGKVYAILKISFPSLL